MPPPFVPGMRVNTEKFGPGRVVSCGPALVTVALERMAHLELNLPLASVTPVEVPAKVPVIGPISSGASIGRAPEGSIAGRRPNGAVVRTAMPLAQFHARRAVEALRFGIVPTYGLRDLTVGFEKLESWVVKNLPQEHSNRPRVSEICGAFGTGKSHTMAAIRLISQQQGYVTASVEVDGSNISLSDPEGLLRQLWPTLAADSFESALPMLDLHVRALDRGRLQAQSSLSDYERVLSNLQMVDSLKRHECLDGNAEEVDAFLSCSDSLTASELRTRLAADLSRGGVSWRVDRIEPKRLIGITTYKRGEDFALCLLGYAVLARRAGFQGLVVTIDEFEVEHNLTSAKWERVDMLVNALAEWLSGDGASASLGMFIATVGQEGHDGDELVASLLTRTDGSRYVLKEWMRQDLRALAQQLHTLYMRAYAFDTAFDPAVAKAVERAVAEGGPQGSGMVRAFIKGYVAELDAVGPHAS